MFVAVGAELNQIYCISAHFANELLHIIHGNMEYNW
jgi:hypothetical protein